MKIIQYPHLYRHVGISCDIPSHGQPHSIPACRSLRGNTVYYQPIKKYPKVYHNNHNKLSNWKNTYINYCYFDKCRHKGQLAKRSKG